MVTAGTLCTLTETAVRSAGKRYAGLVVGAFADGQAVVRGAGVVSADHDAPEAGTLFQIGSVTKVFTSVALADAVLRGQVSLDTPLADILPGPWSSPLTGRITLEQLAAHTSGLPRLPKGLRRLALRSRLDPYRDFSTEDLMTALAGARPRAEPGRRVRYSNFGAALLGEALVRRTGLPYADLVAERVTGPLGLTDTVVRPDPEQRGRAATGHSRPGHPVPDWDLGGMPAAGALYSTATDLLTFLRHQLASATTPLSQALLLAQQPRARANRWVQIGLGWHLIPVRGTSHTALWHNGGTGGFASHISLIPAAQVGVVALTNTARPVDRLALQLLQHLAAPT